MENQVLTAFAELTADSTRSGRTLSSEEILAQKVRWLNETPGTLTGYDCPLCKNRGDSAYAVNGEIVYRPCQCRKIRRSLRNIRRSGLEPLLQSKTFESYQAREDWQRAARQKVQDYAKDTSGAWLLLSGCPGSGKTHLCTAVCGELLRQGVEVRYMLWLDESQKLLAAKTDGSYDEQMRAWKQADVLYIDDFLKIKKGETVTGPMVRLALELVNARYIDARKRTIFSTEWTLEEVIRLDQALGGRLREKTNGFYIHFSGNKDWRLAREVFG